MDSFAKGVIEIADKFIFLLPLLRSRKFAFTIYILDVLDS